MNLASVVVWLSQEGLCPADAQVKRLAVPVVVQLRNSLLLPQLWAFSVGKPVAYCHQVMCGVPWDKQTLNKHQSIAVILDHFML